MSGEIKLETGAIISGTGSELSGSRLTSFKWFVGFFIIEAFLSLLDGGYIVPSDAPLLGAFSEPLDWWLVSIPLYLVLNALMVAGAINGTLSSQGGVLNSGRSQISLIAITAAATVLATIAAAIGFVFLILPGLYLMARWTIVGPLILSGDETFTASFGRSWDVTKASAGAIMSGIVVIYLPFFLAIVALAGLAEAFENWLLVITLLTSAVSAGISLAFVGFAICIYRKLVDDNAHYSEVFS